MTPSKLHFTPLQIAFSLSMTPHNSHSITESSIDRQMGCDIATENSMARNLTSHRF
jgi:hypothetical protein